MNQEMEDPVRTDLSEFGYIEKKMAAAGLLYTEYVSKQSGHMTKRWKTGLR
jgi:hypothetical protein